MKARVPFGLVLLAIGGVVGCNDGDVTKGNTVPPIAGIVGGPDAPDGGGQVDLEVRADEASIETPGDIVVENLDRQVEDAIAEVPAGGLEFVHLKIVGDVGDRLRVSLTHPDEGPISRIFDVTRPRITEVRDPAGPEPVIHAGVAAQITGSGFCTSLGCATVLFDAQQLPTVEDVRPGLLYFNVPAGAALGTHTVRVAVAGTEGQIESYVSEPFTVTLAAP